MTRIKDEQKHLLKNTYFEVQATNRGAILRYIKVNDTLITTQLTDIDTKPASKGAFFVAPIVFGRLLNRTLTFNNNTFEMPYPADINPEEVDPKKIYIHGIHHYYTWDILSSDTNHIEYILSKGRLDPTYPFPHTTTIRYSLHDTNLEISVTIKDCIRETPCMLTMHPFFKFYLDENKDRAPRLKADLTSKFEYDPNSEFPLNFNAPISIDNPFSDFKELSKDFDHSYLAGPHSEILWPNGTHLKISDLTLPDVTPYTPLQIWTTGADSRNAFGVENGGPANLFWLVENKIVNPKMLITVKPDEEKTRKVCYQLMNKNN